MRIEENNIYSFYFPYEGHEITIPVRGHTKEEACKKLQHFFEQWKIEVAMEMPQQAPTVEQKAIDVSIPPPNSYALELSIEALVKEIVPIKKPKGGNTIEVLVKDWTGFTYEAGNFMAIIEVLNKIKNEKK